LTNALTKLGTELEEREEKICFTCKKFGHLVYNCRNKKKEGKGMLVPQNRFKVLSSKVMRCGVEIRKQKEEKKEEKAVQCFKYRSEGH